MKMTPKTKAADARLKRVYNRSLSWYNKQLKKQGGGCAICGRVPRKIRLFTDHNHVVERAKVICTGAIEGGKLIWTAQGLAVIIKNVNKTKAIEAVQRQLKSSSIRGLLCFICNKKIMGLIERFDIPVRKIVEYLETYDPGNPVLRK